MLWFVDIKRHRVHRYDPRDGSTAGWPAPARIGWVLPTADRELLAGLQTVLAAVDPADGHPDGVTTDAAGNVWVGLWGGRRARLDGAADAEDGPFVRTNAASPFFQRPDLRRARVG